MVIEATADRVDEIAKRLETTIRRRGLHIVK